MSTPKGPPGPKPKTGAVKPFLCDDDLSELDTWDETFDALHMGAPPPPAGDEAGEPDPTEMLDVPAEARPSTRLETVGSELAEPPLARRSPDDPSTLDRALDEDEHEHEHEGGAANPAADLTRIGHLDGDDDPLETDFSGLGGGRPAAEPDDDEPDNDDDGVFTSASRPAMPSLDDHLFNDEPAAPPPPEPRRTPAIVRRTPLTAPPAPPLPSAIADRNPGDSDPMFLEQTRIADFAELEPRVVSSRSSAPTTPPPIAEEEDDYADIEVSDDKPATAGVAAAPDAPGAEVYSTSRRTAHVLRRGDSAVRRPPAGPPERPTVVQLDLEDDLAPPRAPSSPPAEDDFSDVAAAVGGRVDHDEPAAERPSRPNRPTPRAPYAAIPDIAHPDVAPEARPRATLDEALDDLRFDEPHHAGARGTQDAAEEPDEAFDDQHAFGAPVFEAPEPQPFQAPANFDPNAFDDDDFGEHADDRHAFASPRGLEDSGAFPPPGRTAPPPPPPARVAAEPETDEPVTVIAPGIPPTPPGGVRPPLGRPPALADLYPRVKTPTSVPPIGTQAGNQAAAGIRPPAPPSRTLREFVPAAPPPEDDAGEPPTRADAPAPRRAR
ncbi:MAG TPA: hypothetical protein VGC42_31365, partial [Kofleriaceae bacterium]